MARPGSGPVLPHLCSPRIGGRVFHNSRAPFRRARWFRWLALAGFAGFGLLAAVAGTGARAGLAGPDAASWLGLAAGVLPGVAAWLVWQRVDAGLHGKRAALRLWGWAVMAQALWPGVAPLAGAAAGLAALAAACGLTLLVIRAFWPLGRGAAAMLLPYIVVTAFAGWPVAGS